MAKHGSSTHVWGIVLAGGDGTRLQPLTRLLTGAPIPKQYCSITGGTSLLEETIARLGGLVPPDRTVAIVNRDHLPLARPQLRSLPSRNVLVQPRNRDTGPGVLLPALEVARRDPDATVAIFPSDHYIGDVGALRSAVRRAAAIADAHPTKIVLLGAEPEWADPGYGYILPGRRLTRTDDVFAVRAFSEKPPLPLAERIVAAGALWNSFILVCRADALLAAARARRRDDVAALATASDRDTLYATMTPWNFSTEILANVTARLVVLRAAMAWSDWGTVDAIERTLTSLGRTPPWRAATTSPPEQRVA